MRLRGSSMSKNLRDSDRKGFVNGFTNQRLKRPQLANVWQPLILTGPHVRTR